MARGRQYYDPIIQVPSKVESAQARRIELYPEGDVTDGMPGDRLRWVGRLIGENGEILDKAQGSFDHDDALRQAQELWPGLEVYELREESEDSTHEGFGPSPRLWQNGRTEHDPSASPFERPALEASEVGLLDDGYIPGAPADITPAVEAPVVRALTVGAPGTYIRLEDVLACLEEYAAQFEEQANPSAALGIREAAAALAEPF